MLKFQENYTTNSRDMEEIFTIIFVIIDDLYQKYAPTQVKERKNVREGKITDPEIITIRLVGEMMGIDSENAWHSFVKKNYIYLFPHLCSRSRFHRRRTCLHQTTDLLRAGLAVECGIGLQENISQTVFRCQFANSGGRGTAEIFARKRLPMGNVRPKRKHISATRCMHL